jgi:hypothetical protein
MRMDVSSLAVFSILLRRLCLILIDHSRTTPPLRASDVSSPPFRPPSSFPPLPASRSRLAPRILNLPPRRLLHLLILPLASDAERKLAPGAEPLAVEVEHVDRDHEQRGEHGEDRRRPLEVETVTDVSVSVNVNASGTRGEVGGSRSVRLHGVEYIAAMPARKSRQRPLPPVATESAAVSDRKMSCRSSYSPEAE